MNATGIASSSVNRHLFSVADQSFNALIYILGRVVLIDLL